MKNNFNILTINPGSTSTKVALFNNEVIVFEEVIRHSNEEISNYHNIPSQLDFRKSLIKKLLSQYEIKLNTLDAIVGRGGLLKPIEGGTYIINDDMLEDLKLGVQGEHASNLGGIIAYDMAKEAGINSYIVDPVVVDELDDIARISGIPNIQRRSIFHALNQKAIARRACKDLDTSYEKSNLIVVHMGGGISVGAHKKGRVVEVANALDGEGPFSPERSGGVPVGDLVKMCFSGDYTHAQIKEIIKGKGGLVAYLNTNDMREVEALVNKEDEKATLIYEAMAYQISKEIGACSVALRGNIDGILLTGGIAYSKSFTKKIEEYVGFISKVMVYPGEDEMLALAQGALRVLNKEEVAKEYIL